MARPGLEPGTPRFSVVRSQLSNDPENPANSRVPSDELVGEKVRRFQAFLADSGDGRRSVAQSAHAARRHHRGPRRSVANPTVRTSGRTQGSMLAFSITTRRVRARLSPSGVDSMITRHGRSASTVSSVLPNSERAGDAPRQRHHDRRRAHVGRLLDDPAPGLAGADLLDVAGDPPPALDLAPARSPSRRRLLRRPSSRRSGARSGRSRARARGCRAACGRRAWRRWPSRARRSVRRRAGRAPSRTRPRGRRPAAGSRPCAWRRGRAPGGGGRRRRSATPRTSQPKPAAATSGCSTTVTTNAIDVPSPPKTANSGRS